MCLVLGGILPPKYKVSSKTPTHIKIKEMTNYNPLLMTSCMEYIKFNNITFDKSVDILIKQDMNVNAEDYDERIRALRNANIVINHYKDFYADRMVKSSRLKTYLMGFDMGTKGYLIIENDIDGKDEDDIMDMIRDLEQGFDEYEEYKIIYDEAINKEIENSSENRTFSNNRFKTHLE